jgi:hypothetical protein
VRSVPPLAVHGWVSSIRLVAPSATRPSRKTHRQTWLAHPVVKPPRAQGSEYRAHIPRPHQTGPVLSFGLNHSLNVFTLRCQTHGLLLHNTTTMMAAARRAGQATYRVASPCCPGAGTVDRNARAFVVVPVPHNVSFWVHQLLRALARPLRRATQPAPHHRYSAPLPPPLRKFSFGREMQNRHKNLAFQSEPRKNSNLFSFNESSREFVTLSLFSVLGSAADCFAQ